MRCAAAADAASVGEQTITEPPLQREEYRFGAGDQFGGAHRVPLEPLRRGHDDTAAPVTVTSQAVAAGVGHRTHTASSVAAAVRAAAQVGVAVQSGGQDVGEAVVVEHLDVVSRDEDPVGDHTHPVDPEASLQVVEHPGQGGDIGGVPGEHVMRDGIPSPCRGRRGPEPATQLPKPVSPATGASLPTGTHQREPTRPP